MSASGSTRMTEPIPELIGKIVEIEVRGKEKGDLHYGAVGVLRAYSHPGSMEPHQGYWLDGSTAMMLRVDEATQRVEITVFFREGEIEKRGP